MASGYIIVAGPQAAGKSTALHYISCKFQSIISAEGAKEFGGKIPDHAPIGFGSLPTNLVILQEMRQYVLRKYYVPGGIFMDWAGESEIIDSDLGKLDDIIEKADRRVYVDETNLFTLAHAGYHNVSVKPCLDEYLDRLGNLNPMVVFLDVHPDTSWQRRKPAYEQRVADFPPDEKSEVLRKYRDYLKKIHYKLHEIYDLLTIPKIMISTEKPLEDALKEVSSGIRAIAGENNVTLIERF